GYYGEPEKTRASFVQNPLNKAYPELLYRTGDYVCFNDRGELVYRGRADHQIKHMGYRIDPGEIECAADRVEGVQMSACFYDEGAMKIVLAYCGEADREYVRAELKKLLPPYMLPARFIRIAEMPLIASGKIDRRRLMREYAAMPAEPRRTAGN
ncbi:MAG: AMP-binding protein, partial [Mailhella sp.]|nr:AMP-binding protein [Mailhella sp.]